MPGAIMLVCWLVANGVRKVKETLRVRLRMTQHLKCDYLVTREIFFAKFCTLVYQSSVH